MTFLTFYIVTMATANATKTTVVFNMQLLAAVLLLCLASTQVLGACVVNTTLGAVRGTAMTSRSGRQFCAYRGIPFAQPPVGDLRFKAPVPASPWSDELDATADGPMCLQADLTSGQITGQEDCLYLNVYTPLISDSGTSVSVPVLFYIFGGGFLVGSGALYNPEFLLDKDIVLVTINYRLGSLGILSSGDDVSPGNYLFKDQLMALKWTAQNIAAFGGEPDKVTIQGQSAGSMSVHALMLSPQSKGLFRAGISQSGSALMPPIGNLDPLSTAKSVAEAVNCSTDDVSSMFDCLRGVDASTLVQKQELVMPIVVEKKTDSNPEPFLTSTPLEIAMSGNFTKIPWMMGVNSEEGVMFAPNDILHQSGLDAVNEMFDSLPTTDYLDFQYSVNESMVPQVWKSVADFFLGDNHTVTVDNALDLIHIYSDRMMTFPIHKANVLHSKAGHFPVYKYEFDYQGLHLSTNLTYDNNTVAHFGAGHGDEWQYLFKLHDWPAGHPDLVVVDTMVTLWTNFVIYGNPTPFEADAPQGVVWPPVDNDSGHVVYYKLGQAQPPTPPVDGVMPLAISTGQDLYKDRVDFWDSLPLMENQGQ